MTRRLRLLCVALAGWLVPLGSQAQALTFSQAAVCGCQDSNARHSGAADLAVDAQGNAYVAGSFVNTISVGSTTLVSAGEADVYVVKIDPQGNYLWAVRGGGSGEDAANALALDGAGHVVLTGFFAGPTAAFGATTLANSVPNPGQFNGANALVAQLDAATGAWRWAVAGTGNAVGSHVAADAQGVYVGGGVYSPAAALGPFAINNPQERSGDVFLAKLSGATGAWQWAVRAGGAYDERLAQLALTATGHLYVAGSFNGANNAGATFGATVLSNPNQRDTYVARVDAGTGAWQWAVQTDPAMPRQDPMFSLGALLVDNQDRVFLLGTMNSRTVRIGAVTLTNNSQPRPVTTSPAPYYYKDVVAAQLDGATGAWGWAVNAGGLDDDEATAYWLDRAGQPTLVGGFRDAPPGPGVPPVQGSRFGATTLTSANGTGFVARLDPATGAWRGVGQQPAPVTLYRPRYDGAGNLYGVAAFAGASASVGGRTLAAWGNCTSSAFVGRLGGTLLPAGEPKATPGFGLYPNPSAGSVRVTGLAPGQGVRVCDVRGRVVLAGTVPASGRLELALPSTRAAGVYLVQAGSQVRRWLVE